MYIPPQFKEERVPVLHDAIRRAGLATLVTVDAEGLVASHVPMLLSPEPAPFGTLRGHLAKANAQWRAALPETQALAIFLGPDAYVSPSWYETKRQTGKVVPTWNYVAIHASGPLRFFEEPEPLLALVSALTERHEAGRPEPWAVADAPEAFIQAQLKGIVGFELPIARLEGKWKLGQNRPAADQAGVVEGLTREGEPAGLAVARMTGGAARSGRCERGGEAGYRMGPRTSPARGGRAAPARGAGGGRGALLRQPTTRRALPAAGDAAGAGRAAPARGRRLCPEW